MNKDKAPTCTAPGCPGLVLAKGFCCRHYQQIRRNGRLIPEQEHIRQSGCCREVGCSETKLFARNLCSLHYYRQRRHRVFIPRPAARRKSRGLWFSNEQRQALAGKVLRLTKLLRRLDTQLQTAHRLLAEVGNLLPAPEKL